MPVDVKEILARNPEYSGYNTGIYRRKPGENG